MELHSRHLKTPDSDSLGRLPTLLAGSLCILLLLASGAARGDANNPYPMVLVHGFIGWGPDEMGGYHYWGGRDSIEDLLREAGHPTFTAVVGPVSSNWDRACELYAYVKGGRVDYGEAHAAKYGHQRYGRSFPGLLPDWGSPGHHEKIHLLGHSQGGQTIRVLTSLLATGSAAEQAATPGNKLSPLFRGKQMLVHSVTSLATPHDGTTLALMLADDSKLLMSWMLSLASSINKRYGDAPSYDFKLDQWDLSQHPDENDKQYRKRLLQSDVWDQPDISVHDLQPAGAAQLNRNYPAVKSVYYFSWAADDSEKAPFGSKYLPRSGMNFALLPSAVAIGRYLSTDTSNGIGPFDASWWPNDGVVNHRSMAGPRLHSSDRIIAAAQLLAPDYETGIWYYMGTRQSWDHLDMVGLQTWLNFKPFYLQLARQLAALPSQ